MKHYIGLDVAMKETYACIVDETGKIIVEKTLPTDPKSIADWVNKTRLSIAEVALESGSLSQWLVTSLQKLNIPTICIDARHLSAVLSMNKNKNDRNDARGIAQALRAHFVRRVEIKPYRHVTIANLLKARKVLVTQRTTLKNTIRGLLKSYGICLSTTGHDSFAKKVAEKQKTLPSIAEKGLNALIETFEMIRSQIGGLDKEVQEVAKEEEDVQLLKTIPGVVDITALNYKIAIGNAARFKESRNVGAYFGLTPKEYASGESTRRGGITKCGHGQMRSLLVESGIVILTRTRSWSQLKAWGMKIAKKKGMKKASVAVGRKLAVIMHRILVTKEPFRFGEGKEKAA